MPNQVNPKKNLHRLYTQNQSLFQRLNRIQRKLNVSAAQNKVLSDKVNANAAMINAQHKALSDK